MLNVRLRLRLVITLIRLPEILTNIRKNLRQETYEAKVDLDFTQTTAGVFESKNGTTRRTDANIRKHFGTIDDFFLTSASQMDSMSFLRFY